MSAKPRQIRQFFNQLTILQHLLTKIRHQEQLLQLIQQKVPAKIARHCHSVTLQDAELRISVDSPVWSSQLRFESPTLLKQLRHDMPSIGGIRIRTAPPPSYPLKAVNPEITQRHCSEATIQHIFHCAEYIDEAALKTALTRLANTMRCKCQQNNIR